MTLSRLLGLGMLAAVAACDAGPLAPDDANEDPAAALDLLAADANRTGDADLAEAASGGALALRLGVRPSEIIVRVGDESVRYQALVVGTLRMLRTGTRVLHRSLIAWTGDRRPVALLQVSQLTDQAVFGYPAELTTAIDPRGRARGTWVDFAAGAHWVATAGPSTIVLAATGEPCERKASDLRCALARYDLRVEGEFHRLSSRGGELDRGRMLPIASGADGVSGVVLGP
jgi:hypothetical protein